MIKESRYYTVLQDDKVKSLIDPRYEIVEVGAVDSSCVRQNIEGKLMQLNYGQIIQLKRVKLSRFKIANDNQECLAVVMLGNNLRITFDQHWSTSQFGSIVQAEEGRDEANRRLEVTGSYYEPDTLMQYAEKNSLKDIVFHGFESTTNWDYIYDCARVAKDYGIKIHIHTHGYFSSDISAEILKSGVSVIFELFSLQPFFYKKHLKADLKVPLENLRELCATGTDIELSTLLIPDENDSNYDLRLFIQLLSELKSSVRWQLRPFYPEHRVLDKEVTSPEILQKFHKEAVEVGINANII